MLLVPLKSLHAAAALATWVELACGYFGLHGAPLLKLMLSLRW